MRYAAGAAYLARRRTPWVALVVALLSALRMGLDEQRERKGKACDCATSNFLRTELPATNIETGEPWACPVCGDDWTTRYRDEAEQ